MQYKAGTREPPSFYRSTVPRATLYLPLSPDTFLSDRVKEKALEPRMQEPDSELELFSGHIRSKGMWPLYHPPHLAPFWAQCSLHLAVFFLSSSVFSLNTQAPRNPLFSLVFRPPNSPLFSLSFPLSPNQCRHLHALCHHPGRLPRPPLPLRLLVSVFLSPLLSFEGPIRTALSTQSSQRLGSSEMK